LHARIEAALLGQVTDRLPRLIADWLIEYTNRALVRHEDIHHHANRAGLARSVRAQQPKDCALANPQANVADSMDAVIGLRDIFERNGIHSLPFHASYGLQIILLDYA